MNKREAKKAKAALEKAIELAGGSQTDLAKKLKPSVTPQAVQKWSTKGFVPVGSCKAVEKATGVTRAELRPDIY